MTQPQESQKIGIINPFNIDKKLLNSMYIDSGIRGVITQLLKHGYDTRFSCAGHGGEPYITFTKGTGDGWFEKNAQQYKLKPKKPQSCCKNNKKRFCTKCGASKTEEVYSRKEAFDLF